MRIKASRLGLGSLAITAAALVGTAGSSASAQAPPSVTIDRIQLAGSACRGNTADVFLSEDKQSFFIVYRDFRVEAGPGIPRGHASRDCSAIVRVNIPRGFTYAVASVVASGHAELQEGVVGLLRARVRFPGMRPAFTEVRVSGPTEAGGQDFDVPQQMDLVTYSRCGAEEPLTINLDATVDNTRQRSGSGIITVSDQSGVFITRFNLVYKRC